jgi:hypothetical protein
MELENNRTTPAHTMVLPSGTKVPMSWGSTVPGGVLGGRSRGSYIEDVTEWMLKQSRYLEGLPSLYRCVVIQYMMDSARCMNQYLRGDKHSELDPNSTAELKKHAGEDSAIHGMTGVGLTEEACRIMSRVLDGAHTCGVDLVLYRGVHKLKQTLPDPQRISNTRSLRRWEHRRWSNGSPSPFRLRTKGGRCDPFYRGSVAASSRRSPI